MLRGRGLLTSIQRAFLKAFAGLPDQEHFYLVGGTALAEFYLGHRLSLDLDLFTAEDALILPISYQVERFGAVHEPPPILAARMAVPRRPRRTPSRR